MNRNHIEEAIFVLAVVNEQMTLVRLGLWVLGLRGDSIFLENFKLCCCIEKNFVLISGVDAATIQRAAAGLPSNIYNTLAQVASATPRVSRMTPGVTPGATPQVAGGFSNFNVVCFLC